MHQACREAGDVQPPSQPSVKERRKATVQERNWKGRELRPHQMVIGFEFLKFCDPLNSLLKVQITLGELTP